MVLGWGGMPVWIFFMLSMKEGVITIVKKEPKTFLVDFLNKSKFYKKWLYRNYKNTLNPIGQNFKWRKNLQFLYYWQKGEIKIRNVCQYQKSTSRNTDMAHAFTKKSNSHIKSIGNPWGDFIFAMSFRNPVSDFDVIVATY